MTKQMHSFPQGVKSAERLLTPPSPTERPTVAKAEVTSKSVVRYGYPSEISKISEKTVTKIIASATISRDLETTSREIRLLNKTVSVEPRMIELRLAIMMVKVVVLTPPPVLPGE